VCKFQEIWPKISGNLADGNRWNRVLLTWQNKNWTRSPTLATVWIAPKICHGQPPTMYSECSRFHPNQFTFGGVIVEHMNTVKTCCKVNPIFGWIDVLCANFTKFGWRKSVKSCVAYLTKKTKIRLAVPLLLLRGLRLKSAMASLRQCTQSAPDFIQIGSLSAEL